MTDIYTLEAVTRKKTGSTDARRLRNQEDKVPAVIYGAGKDTKSIEFLHKDVLHALQHEGVFSHILTIKIDGKPEKAVLKSINRHPSKPRILHIDFLRIKAKEKITMNVPIHYLGEEECPGIKDGGVISKHMTDIEIRCLPGDLPESINVDVSNMQLDDVLHISDLPLPSGVELTILELDEEHNQAIFSIHIPKVIEEEVEELPEEAEGEEIEGEGEEGAGVEASAEKGEEKTGAKKERAEESGEPKEKQSKEK